MIEYDTDLYDHEYDPDDDDYGPLKEEPYCGRCNDSGWAKPHGVLRRILARVLPLCVVWWQWHGLLYRWGTLGDSWPCGCRNTTWIDTWWLPRQLTRLRWWRYDRKRVRGAYYDDESPF